jgi:hypothetical protein
MLPFLPVVFTRFIRVWIWIGLGLLLIAVARWVLVALGVAELDQWMTVGGMAVRVLNAAQTLFLLQVLIIAWYAQQHHWRLPLLRWLPVLFFAAVVILQQRSVWVCALVVILLILFREVRIRRRLWRSLAVVGVVSLVLGLTLWGKWLAQDIKTSSQSTVTWEWRVMGWQALLDQRHFNEPLNYIWGQPLGTGYYRELWQPGYSVEVSPHNYYLQVMLDLGVLGLIMLLTLYFVLLKTLGRYARNQGPQRLVWMLLVSQLVFFIPYAPNFAQGIVLGLALIMYRFARLEQAQAKLEF